MAFPDPSGSIYGQMAGMESRRVSVTPSSGSGTGGRSVGNTSSRHRSRMSDPPSGTRLMPQFNAAAAADGGGSWSSSPVGLEVALDEWRRRNIRFRPIHETRPTTPPTPHQVARLLLFGSPMRSPAADDNVLIMDGVLVGNSGPRIASSTRRSVSFSGPGFVSAGSPGSIGGSSCGSNGQLSGSSSSGDRGSGCDSSTVLLFGLLGSGDGGRVGSNGQFAQGREGPRRMQTMRPRFSEVASPNSGRSSIGSPNMQGSPIAPHLFPPTMPGPAFPTASPRPRAVSSYSDAAVTIRPLASYFTPPRVTVLAPRPSPSTPMQPETEPVQPPPTPPATSFAWPPTAEEDASITQQLYGPNTGARRRLPVFQGICPAEAE